MEQVPLLLRLPESLRKFLELEGGRTVVLMGLLVPLGLAAVLGVAGASWAFGFVLVAVATELRKRPLSESFLLALISSFTGRPHQALGVSDTHEGHHREAQESERGSKLVSSEQPAAADSEATDGKPVYKADSESAVSKTSSPEDAASAVDPKGVSRSASHSTERRVTAGAQR